MLKSGILGSKREHLGLKNHEPTTKLERQKGAKCSYFLKSRQGKGRERDENSVFLATLWPMFTLEQHEN
ncbi:hypothetical protein HMPREF2955_02315 [Prevotella sp. HMSC073D09]|nr:hypothetical protein HMPREF2955_02315 [Prevotella sp. HMSC073D09]